ncbi:hypothetical protein BBJ28_00004708 [Nothophytophthora sp. Chile5]|nr:hypothetical protein BBJ28_00004708 [Nothophytophthora sp. Chile5]
MDGELWFYAVAVGRTTGVFTSWNRAQTATRRYPGAKFRKFLTLAEAERFLDVHGVVSVGTMGRLDGDTGRVYAVAVGRRTGIFTDWNEAKRQTLGYSGASVKGFPCYADAAAFLDRHQWRPIPELQDYRASTGFLTNSATVNSPEPKQLANTDVKGSTAEPVCQVSQKRERNEDQETQDANASRPTQRRRIVRDSQVLGPEFEAFCYGRAISNPYGSAAAAGFACVFPNHPEWDIARKLDDLYMLHPSNNGATYAAVLEAVKRASRGDPSQTVDMCIFTDCRPVVNVMESCRHRWQLLGCYGEMATHRDLIERILEEKGDRRIKWQYVRARTGGGDWASKWSDIADVRAEDAAYSRCGGRAGGRQSQRKEQLNDMYLLFV